MSWLDLWMVWCIAFGGFKTGVVLIEVSMRAVRWAVARGLSVNGSGDL